VLLRRAGNSFCEWPEDQAKKALSRPREQQSSSAIMHTPRDRDRGIYEELVKFVMEMTHHFAVARCRFCCGC